MKKNSLSSITALCLALALALFACAAVFGLARTAYAASEPAGVSDDANASDPDAPVSQDNDGAAEPKEGDSGDGSAIATGESDHEETPEEKAERKAAEKKERIKRGVVFAVIGAAASLGIVAAVTVPGWKKSGTKPATTTMLAESALMIAIATVCSLIKIDLPFGGGVTVVSMLPLIMISHRHGWRWGLLTAFAYSLIQLIFGLDNVGYAANIPMAFGIVFFDYIVAYTVLGLSGIFGKKRASVAVGIAVTFGLRFLCHYVTGVWIWKEWMPEKFFGLTMTTPFVYSALYNGWYMFVELALTMLVAMLIYKPLEKFFTSPVENAAEPSKKLPPDHQVVDPDTLVPEAVEKDGRN